MIITLLLISIARYFLSGLRNGFIYDQNYKPAATANLAALFCLYVAGYYCIVGYGWNIPNWPARSAIHGFIDTTQIVFVALSAIASILVLVRSENKYVNDLHLKTTLESVFYSGLCAVSGLVPLLACILAVYPGVLLQKIAINLLSGLPWNAEQTDDETGATYGIPSLGIKIPRLNFTKRIVFAAISLVAAIILHYKLN
jgi:hypothetical protein